ncbi:MAG: AraC family transcriptional regulator [Acidobacteria bacterium OLB17]|nr:MAG: AraC family transcriptional regulator [Acidobacteria bacterium OLB17]MCZ2391157.1 AraC family transcriptional regulator [Acidobacteriota bacterium]
MHIPRPPLDRFVSVIIYFRDVLHDHNFDRFLPNGDTEIVIDLNDAPQFIYDNHSLKEIQACNRVWASGFRTEPITIPAGNSAEMMVVTFKKGLAASFFPFPMQEIADSVVDADLVWGMDFGWLRERLLAQPEIPKRFSLVETFLLSKFRSRLFIDPCVSFAVNEMTERPYAISIGRMNEKIGYSQKHFTDLFRKAVGVTPKAYLKIMRFQKAITAIDTAGDIDWRDIALSCGFYDQSHFINDFKHFSGFKPEAYAAIRTHYQNYIPVG